MKRIRVLVVEDSPTARDLICDIIDRHPGLEVAAAVASGEEALRTLDRVAPDVISLDIRLPGMNGFEVTRRIMARRPTPIVVVSASVETSELNITMNALRAGALAVVEKPTGPGHPEAEALARNLCTQLTIMTPVKLVTRRYRRDGRPEPSPPDLARERPPSPDQMESPPVAGVGILASTGGPRALTTLLDDLGPGFPIPVYLVQHITPSFLSGFVKWLDGICPLRAVEAQEGMAPEPGVIHVAPAGRHLELRNGRLRTVGGAPVSGQRPSGTVLFRSLASSLGASGAGVVLTGMGDDGAEGLLDLRRAGGYTVAEDASSAVVYGMPRAAVERGAAAESLPLRAIAPRLRDLAGVPEGHHER